MREYAVYKGDELLVIGTAEECAGFMGVKSDTIKWHATPTGKKRSAARKKQYMCIVVERIS